MPLDTQPLSSKRRAMMLLVLLGVFVGSVAFAQMLVKQRRGMVSFSVAFPSVLTPIDEAQLPFGVYEARVGKINGEERRIEVYRYEVAPLGDAAFRRFEARRLYLRAVGLEPAEDDVTIAENQASLGGWPAWEIIGPDSTGKGFVMLRLAAVSDKVIAVLYTGPGKLNDVDKLYFSQQCKEPNFRIISQRKATRTEAR